MIAAEERQTRGVEYYPYLLDDRGVWQRESPWVMALIGDCVRHSLHEAWAIMTDECKKPEKEHRGALWALARNAGSSGFQRQVSDVLYQAAKHYPDVTWTNAIELDRSPDYIACKNGVVFIDAGKPHIIGAAEARTKLLTNSLQTEWHDNAPEHYAVNKLAESYDHQWDWTLDYLGRQMHGEPGEMFLYIEGPRNSAKGTVVAALRGALGAQCGAIDAGVFAPKNGHGSSHNDATYPLVSSLIAVGDELGDSIFANRGGEAAELKRLTGGAATLVWFSAKSEKGAQRYIRAGIILIGNTRPYMNLTDPAMVKRFRIVKPKQHGTNDLSVRSELLKVDGAAARDFLNRLIHAACRAQAGSSATLPEIEDSDSLPDWMTDYVRASVLQDSSSFDAWLEAAVQKADENDALGGQHAMHSSAMWLRYCLQNGWKGTGGKTPNSWAGISYKDALRAVSNRFGVELNKTRIRLDGKQASGFLGVVLLPEGSYEYGDEEQHESPDRAADTTTEAQAGESLEREHEQPQTAPPPEDDEDWMR